MSESQDPGSDPPDEPPRMVLHALYAGFAMILLAVLVIVGVYGV